VRPGGGGFVAHRGVLVRFVCRPDAVLSDGGRSFRDASATPAISAQRRILDIDGVGHLSRRGGLGSGFCLLDGGSHLGVLGIERLADCLSLRGFVFVAHHELILPAIAIALRLYNF
jgi:hypothetical protein